jgi:hypothetical protein
MLGSQVSVRFARDLRPNDFKTGDVILLGASEADPWVELYEPRLNFLFRDDYNLLSAHLGDDFRGISPAVYRRFLRVWTAST